MNLQVSIPKKHLCVYQCPFCISKIHTNYQGTILTPDKFVKRLKEHLEYFQYQSIIITGENEPLQQPDYVIALLKNFKGLELTFKGYMFRKFAQEHKNLLKNLSVVNISVSNDDIINFNTMYNEQLEIAKACHSLGIKVRMTYVLTKQLSIHVVREALRLPYVDQITLKELQGDTEWIRKNKSNHIPKMLIDEAEIITQQGRFIIFKMKEKEIWIDTNCQETDEYKIFRPDGEIYNAW